MSSIPEIASKPKANISNAVVGRKIHFSSVNNPTEL